MLKILLNRKWYVVISPPSLYITRKMTFKEANQFITSMRESGNTTSVYIIVRDVFGSFTKKYIPKKYPINFLILKS